MAKRRSPKTIDTIRHKDASRKNIPTAEYQAVMADDERSPISDIFTIFNNTLLPEIHRCGRTNYGRAIRKTDRSASRTSI